VIGECSKSPYLSVCVCVCVCVCELIHTDKFVVDVEIELQTVLLESLAEGSTPQFLLHVHMGV
jgi:hypothetical protein